MYFQSETGSLLWTFGTYQWFEPRPQESTGDLKHASTIKQNGAAILCWHV